MKDVHLHYTKCSAVLKNARHPHLLQDLLYNIGEGPFSLIRDELTYISITKLLGIAIVYYTKRKDAVAFTLLCLTELQQRITRLM